MCLAALAIGLSPRFPLVVAANRDEYFERAAAPLAWWRPRGVQPPVLGGRDLAAGGTWLGISAAGRLALLTDVREPARHDPQAPSRGAIATDWLSAREPTPAFIERITRAGHNGFNLVAIDGAAEEAWWVSNREATARRLVPGLYGLSNAALDTPWPKLVALKSRLAIALAAAGSGAMLAESLWPALADPTPAPDSALPATGIPLERERQLSSAFIRVVTTSGSAYGTRCSTLVIADADGGLQVAERSFAPEGQITNQTTVRIDRWPAHRPSG